MEMSKELIAENRITLAKWDLGDKVMITYKESVYGSRKGVDFGILARFSYNAQNEILLGISIFGESGGANEDKWFHPGNKMFTIEKV